LYFQIHFFIFHALSFSSSIRRRGIIVLFSKNTTVLIDKKFTGTMSQERKMYPCTCSDCGKDSEVPFEPKQDRPVYCKECLPKHRK
jgi:CxxC-x17-CxxC domain-containing protein